MSTSIGRLIEHLNYASLLLIAVGTLLASTTYFVLAPTEHGLNSRGFGDAIYFSIVTFTSLGYGDVLPSGFGRAVAAIDVLVGLSVTALIVGKVASERQSTLLLLLYTSDVQRRLSSFTRQLHEAADRITSGGPTRPRALKSANGLLDALSSYVSFNAFQAGALDFGNFTALTMLCDALDQVFAASISAFEAGDDPDSMRRAFKLAQAIERLVNLMSRLHRKGRGGYDVSKPKAGGSRRARSRAAAARKAHELREAMGRTLRASVEWRDKGFHALQVERVFEAVPSGETWETGMHREVAVRLGISASIATRCITELKESGRLPKLNSLGTPLQGL